MTNTLPAQRAPHLSHIGRTDPAPFRGPQPERLGLYPDVERAVGAARHAFLSLDRMSLETRQRIVEAIRGVARRDAAELGRMAAEETGLGRPEDKTQKNLLVANRTPGPEILQAEAVSGDNGLTLTERAPYGVVAAITPSTNPTSTIFNNAISILSAGNAVVFNVHPGANRVCNETIRRINAAITAAGGPPDLLTAP
ncbi:MAG: aldehyde dehydrogenase family protein, partial [Chloroflexi bacterium]|nr:aldehyde dehydrogenase family protein [Chloroflexota bacterium]